MFPDSISSGGGGGYGCVTGIFDFLRCNSFQVSWCEGDGNADDAFWKFHLQFRTECIKYLKIHLVMHCTDIP